MGGSSNRRASQKDKVLLFDIGVRNALLKTTRDVSTPEERGLRFEHWCLLQSLYMASSFKRDWEISSYLDYDGHEVDLIVQTHDQLFLIEIKSGTKPRNDWARGFAGFAKSFPSEETQCRIWYTGETRQLLDGGIEVLPYRDGLAELWSL